MLFQTCITLQDIKHILRNVSVILSLQWKSMLTKTVWLPAFFQNNLCLCSLEI